MSAAAAGSAPVDTMTAIIRLVGRSSNGQRPLAFTR
jgi:hypothetical protein